eukprot:CAMPEP_0167781722 /NCGR_PEP_ID=MMETSP0111_2-20121227/6093_1 /TAXON_ID=91324 /ORGANISM="Lotharella globosa, Strain CCCM811" /LENGTH=498 /DNA_ID=CAMNT_0007672421 /DNA_START=620 /DNA_END=2116 /DNA_ORIENTATION=+
MAFEPVDERLPAPKRSSMSVARAPAPSLHVANNQLLRPKKRAKPIAATLTTAVPIATKSPMSVANLATPNQHHHQQQQHMSNFHQPQQQKQKQQQQQPKDALNGMGGHHVRTTVMRAKDDQIQINRWVRCYNCKKWRRIPLMAPFESISPKWMCSMGNWGQRLSCNMDQEALQNEKVLTPAEAQKYYVIEKSNFDNHLASFLEMFSKKMRRTPMINSKPLDLYRLYREVVAMGGCDRVIQQEGCWTRIFRTLENFSVKVTDASYRLKRYYKHYLYAYEQHFFFGKPLTAAQFQNDVAKPSRRTKGGTSRGTRGMAATGRWKNTRGRWKRGRVPSPMNGRNAAFQAVTPSTAATADVKQNTTTIAAVAAPSPSQFQLQMQTNAATQLSASAAAATTNKIASNINKIIAEDTGISRVLAAKHPKENPVVSKQYLIPEIQRATNASAVMPAVTQNAAQKTAVAVQGAIEQPVVRQIVGIQNGAVSLSQWMDGDKKAAVRTS